MPGKRNGSIAAPVYFALVGSICVMVLFIKKYNEGENIYMSNIGELIAVITAVAGILTVFITQIFFYRKDSNTMSEIKESQDSGNEKLQSQIDSRKASLSCEHEKLENDHKELRDIVKEIRLKQEQELELQKNIRDTVPDAEMIKDGIDKICRENAMLRAEVSNLKREIERLQKKNKELSKSSRKLIKEIEHSLENNDDT